MLINSLHFVKSINNKRIPSNSPVHSVLCFRPTSAILFYEILDPIGDKTNDPHKDSAAHPYPSHFQIETNQKKYIMYQLKNYKFKSKSIKIHSEVKTYFCTIGIKINLITYFCTSPI